jgi:hypothetical protein
MDEPRAVIDALRRAPEVVLPLVSVLIMFRHLALHDFLHAYRIEDLLLRRDWPV